MKKIAVLFLFIIMFGGIYLSVQKYPAVSVIMPTYNCAEMLPRAIESILNQTYKDFEFIIVDDGSTDDTARLLKEYSDKDKRIRILRNGKNKGIAYSRQRGLDAARGKYIAVMDSDDWSVPERLQKQIDFMDKNPEIDAVTGKLGNLENIDISNYKPDSFTYTIKHLPGFFETELMFCNMFPNVSSFFKRAFVEKNNIHYDAALVSAEDYDFWRQVVMAGGKMVSLFDTLVYIRSHHSNVSTYYNEMTKNSIEIHKKMFSRFFEPDADELKFSYTKWEKCHLLKKIKQINAVNPKMSQIYLENSYETQCPSDLNNSYYVKHTLNRWEGFLGKIEGDKYIRVGTKDIGTLKIKPGKIEMHWNAYPPETFVLSEKSEWIFEPSGKTIKLKHINWATDFIVSDVEKGGCRTDVKTECAHIRYIFDDVLWVDWINPAWPSEEFKKEKGVFKFVRELNENEKI